MSLLFESCKQGEVGKVFYQMISPPVHHVSSHHSRLYTHTASSPPSSAASQILPAQPQHPSAISQTTPFIKGAQIQETSAHSSRTMKMMIMLLISALIASGVAFAPLPPARDRDDTCPCADPNPCFHESIGDGSCVPLEEAYTPPASLTLSPKPRCRTRNPPYPEPDPCD